MPSDLVRIESLNRHVGQDVTIDATSLPAVRMPGRDRFVPDDRTGGPGFK